MKLRPQPLPKIKAEAAPAIQGSATPLVLAMEHGDDGKPKRPQVSSMSYSGGKMRVFGYDQPIVFNLETSRGINGEGHPLYMGHDSSRIVGHGSSKVVAGDDGKMHLETNGKLRDPEKHVDAGEIVELAGEDFPWQSSIGAMPDQREFVPAGQKKHINGREQSGPFYALSGELNEVSIVPRGADTSTSTSIAAELQQGVVDVGFEAWLKAKGFVKAELSDSAMASLKAMYEAESAGGSASGDGGEGEGNPSVDSVIAAAREREQRQEAYGRIVAGAIERGMDSDTAESLVRAASNDNIGETEFELQVLRASRRQGSTDTFANGDGGANPQLIEAAVARATGIEAVEEQYNEEVLQASEDAYRNGVSLEQLLIMAAAERGVRNVSRHDVNSLLQGAFAPVSASAGGSASTIDVGGILSNIANKAIKAGFMSVEMEWNKIVSTASTNDLKEMTSYALTGDFEYQEVPKSGELTHADLGEEKYTNQAKTFGRMFALTEDDIINDDLGAFNRVRRLLGRGSALAMNRVIWKAFLDDQANFWTAARKNRLTGAGSALDVDSLSAAVTALESQVDPDGNPMGVLGSVLVCPLALKVQAGRLANDPEIRVTGATSKETYTTSNPHSGKFSVAASTYLNNAKIGNGSDTRWWLLADPEDIPTLEVVFLRGQRAPRIETARANFDILGIQMRGVHRFGANLQEYRGSICNNGS
ncbi:MAG: hypothetical protein AAGG44_13790 [Planctomycetota bacterium]